MQKRKLITLFILLFPVLILKAQKKMNYEEVNTTSYALYEKADWKALLHFGKEALADGEDFVLLRLRIAYAAFMLNNFSEALKHYDAVIKSDRYNETAHYYSWLCLGYLNKSALAGAHVKYFSKEHKEKFHPIAFTRTGIEASYKYTDYTQRDHSFYTRFDISNRWGWNIHMDQAFAIYNQTINEPLLVYVKDNNNINVNQKEYYNKLSINLGRHLQFKAAYHYIYTPFNNFTYQNHAGMFGLQYSGNYFDVQADAVIARLVDSSQQQYNLQLGLYPLGNLNLYGFSTAMFRNRNDKSGFNFKQVIGAKLFKNIWLEGNATFGTFSNLFENDALYLYNAIDKNKLKAGAALYITIGKKCTVQACYTFEKREFYNRTITFNQHSITGGLSWKF
ncbi:MAG: hypothetical protein QM737_23435 [Ferruginibacter sp.]